jgi:hypothetical protein
MGSAVSRTADPSAWRRAPERRNRPLSCYAWGVRIPVWFALTVAAFVVLFGAYRIKLGLTLSPEQEETAKKRGGLYAMGKRFHLFIGTIYILMGVGLTAMAFGWQPLGNSVGPATETPPQGNAPTKGAVPIDQLPTKK